MVNGLTTNEDNAVSGNRRNKLGTYKTLKYIYERETYTNNVYHANIGVP